jgi:hypothetical protein
MTAYDRDLAYIHDTGFTGFVRKAAPGLLRLLRQNGIRGGRGGGRGLRQRRVGAGVERSRLRSARNRYIGSHDPVGAQAGAGCQVPSRVVSERRRCRHATR